MSTQTINFNICIDSKIFSQEFYRTDDGEPISPTNAKQLKDDFEQLNHGEKVLAFHFGIDELRNMIQKADAYNSITTNVHKVVGFDFYRCLTTRRFSNSSGETYEIPNELDLVIFPTTKEQILHDLVPAAEVPVLTHSRPCPKLCS